MSEHIATTNTVLHVTLSCVQVGEGVGGDAPGDFPRDVTVVPPQPVQLSPIEVLHYRETLLLNLKHDPRFLRLLPLVFPLRPDVSQAEDSAVMLAFCMRQLAMMYPGYSERGGLASPKIHVS